MTNDDIWKCKYVTAGEDKDGITVPCCTLCGLPCEDVLRYGDEGCVLSMTTEKAIKIIEDACWWYHKKGCSGLTQVEIFEARDRAIQALNSLEEVYANGYNDGFTQAEVNYENDKALSQEPICDRDCEHCTWTECPIEPCDDAISREDAEQMFRNIRSHLKPQDYKSAEEFNTRDLMLLNAEQMIHALPSVTQKSETVTEFADRCRECGAKYGKMLEQKSGKWIDRQFQSKIDGEIRNGWECSECGERFFRYDLVNTDEFIPKYCPNCGAKMESEE